MKKCVLTLLLFSWSLLVFAQNKLTPVASQVFKNVRTKASPAEQNKICKELDLSLGADHSVMMSKEFPVSVDVYPTDLNKDGLEELFLVFGSTSLFGNTGEGFELYQQTKAGSFVKCADVGGQGSPTFLSSSNLGYPDFLVGGPGFEFPVYRWNGKTYKYSRQIKDAALKNKTIIGLDSLRKMYVPKP